MDYRSLPPFAVAAFEETFTRCREQSDHSAEARQGAAPSSPHSSEQAPGVPAGAEFEPLTLAPEARP